MAEIDRKLVVLGNLIMRMGDALEMTVMMAEDYAKRCGSGPLRFEPNATRAVALSLPSTNVELTPIYNTYKKRDV